MFGVADFLFTFAFFLSVIVVISNWKIDSNMKPFGTANPMVHALIILIVIAIYWGAVLGWRYLFGPRIVEPYFSAALIAVSLGPLFYLFKERGKYRWIYGIIEIFVAVFVLEVMINHMIVVQKVQPHASSNLLANICLSFSYVLTGAYVVERGLKNAVDGWRKRTPNQDVDDVSINK